MPKDSHSPLFFVDRGPSRDQRPPPAREDGDGVGCTGAAWSDDEESLSAGEARRPPSRSADARKTPSARGPRKSALLLDKPSWAQKVPDQDEAAVLDPLCIVDLSNGASRSLLLPDHLGVRRYKSLAPVHKASVACLQFHPSRPWLLVGRSDGLLSVSEVGATGNSQLFLCKVPRDSILAARYTVDGTRVLLCSSRSGVLAWNLEKRLLEPLPRYSSGHQLNWASLEVSSCGKHVALLGKDGRVALLSGSGLAALGELRMNGSALCGAFDSRGQLLLTAGSEQKIYVWSLASLRCVKVLHVDSGCAITSLTISPDGAHLLVGTALGVLGLCAYETVASTPDASMPLEKLFMNLITRISCARVHPSSELFCFSSPDRVRALRMVHLRTLRVFPNWPKDTTPLHKVRDVAFDASGHYMAIGNDKGNVLVYGLSHFQ